METFIQPKITGYRQLTADEAALINEGKALAEQCGAYIAKLRGYVPKDVNEKLESGEIGEYKAGSRLDQRWISIGSTDLQRGFMAVMRGIAQPTTF